jgi:branched-chain amino acid transport system substrate-binding protein
MEARRIAGDSVVEKSGRGRWLRRSAAALAAAHMVAACTETDTVTLGASVQLTGNLSDTGRIYRDAYQFAVDRINAQGGVMIGEKPHKLALKILDNKSDLKLAAEQQERLVTKDRVNFLLGPFSSNAVLAGAAVAEKYQVPMVQGGGASSQIFARGYKYVFGTLPASTDYFRSTIAMLEQLEPRAKTVGLVSGDDSFDVTLSKETSELVKKAGLEVVLDQQYSERSPNFFNILTLVKGRAPDVLLWSGHEAGAINFIRQSRSRKVSPNLLASFTVGVTSANFRKVLGDDANYAFGMTPWLPTERLKDRWFGDAVQFAKAYEEKFGYAPDYHAAAAVAAVQAFVEAMKTSDSFDPGEVRDALANLEFESIYGRVHFGDNGQITMPQTVVQIQGDKLIEIFTDKFINQPLYPVPAWDKRS